MPLEGCLVSVRLPQSMKWIGTESYILSGSITAALWNVNHKSVIFPPPCDAELLQIETIKINHFAELKTGFKINKGREERLLEA